MDKIPSAGLFKTIIRFLKYIRINGIRIFAISITFTDL